jgi:hypothetical protein
MLKTLIATLVLAMSYSAHVFADESQENQPKSKAKIQDVNGKKNKVEGDIDEEITNAKLRAESGSKSKFSLSATATYTGGSIVNAFGTERPNIKGTPEQQVNSSMGGGLNGRYRWTKNDSFTAGTTYGIMTPLQGDVHKTPNQFNVFDPNVAYNHVSKVMGFQTVAVLGYAYGTSNESRNVDLTHQFGVAYNAMYAFKNRITAGAQVAADYNVYTSAPGDNKAGANPDQYGGDKRVDWDFAIYPQAEYQFNDTFSARTVFGYFNWKHLYGDSNQARLLQTFVYQSIGVGISVARDVFLYPNVQFLPGNLHSDFTNVAMTATLNIF